MHARASAAQLAADAAERAVRPERAGWCALFTGSLWRSRSLTCTFGVEDGEIWRDFDEMGEIGGDIAKSACFLTFGNQTTKENRRNPKNSAKFGRI